MTHDTAQAPSAEPVHESRWPASLACLAAILLYVTLPGRLTLGPVWLLPVLEAALLVPLTLTSPRRVSQEALLMRLGSLALIALINIANLVSLALLLHSLLTRHVDNAYGLLVSAAAIWLTNVIVFALWYWELDRGGPGRRSAVLKRMPDFLFPQMAQGSADSAWVPRFVDYLYVAFTNASAFSPTDTMPLTGRAKMLMLVQSLASLLTIGLVAARAVNILK